MGCMYVNGFISRKTFLVMSKIIFIVLFTKFMFLSDTSRILFSMYDKMHRNVQYSLILKFQISYNHMFILDLLVLWKRYHEILWHILFQADTCIFIVVILCTHCTCRPKLHKINNTFYQGICFSYCSPDISWFMHSNYILSYCKRLFINMLKG